MALRDGFTRRHGVLLSALQQTLDATVISLSLFVLTLWRTGDFDAHYQMLLLVSLLLMVVVYRWSGTYQNLRFGGVIDDAKALFQPWVTVLVCLVTIGFMTKTTEQFSRQVLMGWALAGYLSQVIVHSAVRLLLRRLRRRGYNTRYALLAGPRESAERFAEVLKSNAWLGIVVVGRVGPEELSHVNGEASGESNGLVRFLGGFDQVETVVTQFKIDMIYITVPMHATVVLEEAAQSSMNVAVDTHWVPDIQVFSLINHHVWEIAGQPIIALTDSPYSGFNRLIKWLEDKAISGAMLLVFSLPMIIIGLVVVYSSPGPALFRQKRLGFGGKVFEILKFRTMNTHREEPGVVTQATDSDPRVTGVGAFLRRTSLDELPQLFNVLRGDMSLVGPRPHAVEHNDYYRSRIDAYMLRHKMKPGMTGLAQIRGFRGETRTDAEMRQRVEYDLLYINHWSLWLDVKILMLTILCVITGRNAH